MNSKPQNIYINPKLVVSSGNVHINKRIFSVGRHQSQLIVPRVNPESKIHYNPKFFNSIPNQTVNNVASHSKTIYVNPSFSQNINFDNLARYESGVKGSNCETFMKSNRECDVTERKPILNDHLRNNVLPQSVLSSSEATSTCFSYTRDLSNKFKTVVKSNVINNRYCKINSQSSVSPKAVKITKYKIQRNCKKGNTCVSPSKSFYYNTKIPTQRHRLSSSFKKIGKRKLVRKSLIQNHIVSRRLSLPSMMQYSRNIVASRKKQNRNISRSKFKVIRCDDIKTGGVSHTYKIPRRSKLKWTRTRDNSRTEDFVKIGRRKIVRKSILQSIIEARKSRMNSFKNSTVRRYSLSKLKGKESVTCLRSRFKVIRNMTVKSSIKNTTNNSLYTLRRKSVINLKKKELSGFSQISQSKSVLFRMPPSLRYKIRHEEKRKRLMLMKKVNNRKKCLYFNRFGHCKGLDDGTCKKVHDPKSVAVCRKYLKGACDGEGCKLSHEVVPEKMPTCHQFLAGVCVRPSCPFLHVKLGQGQPICTDFLQGFCQLGDSCSKRHQFICPEWDKQGFCKLDKCPYPHPSVNSQRRNESEPSKAVSIVDNNIESTVAVDSNNQMDDIRGRYFTLDTPDIDVDQTINSDRTDVKADVKDGVNSVYLNESLMAFIPFS